MMDNMELEKKELIPEELEKASGGRNAVFGSEPEPASPYQPYEIEDAPDDIGLPKYGQ